MRPEEIIVGNKPVNSDEETVVNGQRANGSDASAKKTGKGADWKQVTIGSAAGVFFGTLLTSFVPGPDSIAKEEGAAGQEEQSTGSSGDSLAQESGIGTYGVPVAESVTDDMSFAEAFAAARSELGAGGVFTWHGGVYGTYYADEWNSMTDAERAEFSGNVHSSANLISGSTGAPEAMAEGVAQETVATDLERPADESEHGEEQSSSDGDLIVLGVEHDPNSSITTVETMADGQFGIFVDLDNDGTIDAFGMDYNNDGIITGEELEDASELGLTTQMFQHMMDVQDGMADNLPDYTNDANVGEYGG